MDEPRNRAARGGHNHESPPLGIYPILRPGFRKHTIRIQRSGGFNERGDGIESGKGRWDGD